MAIRPIPQKVLYTLAEAAESLCVCRATVVRLIAAGHLNVRGDAKMRRIYWKDLDDLAQRGIPSVWPSKPAPNQRPGYVRPEKRKKTSEPEPSE